MSSDTSNVTRLLQQWRGGDRQALDQLIPVVYHDLRRLARGCLQGERPGHTLRATELVHEAYLRLMDADIAWKDRAHFYAIAARVLRRILVEYARAHNRQKRGSGQDAVPLDETLESPLLVGPQATAVVVEIDQALERLAVLDARRSELLQLLYFGGLTYDEAAAALGISAATVHRELKLAKAWLRRELAKEQAR